MNIPAYDPSKFAARQGDDDVDLPFFSQKPVFSTPSEAYRNLASGGNSAWIVTSLPRPGRYSGTEWPKPTAWASPGLRSRSRRIPGAEPRSKTARSRPSGRFALNFGRRLVWSKAAPTRMAQPPVTGPLPVANLTHQFGPDEGDSLRVLAGKWLIER